MQGVSWDIRDTNTPRDGNRPLASASNSDLKAKQFSQLLWQYGTWKVVDIYLGKLRHMPLGEALSLKGQIPVRWGTGDRIPVSMQEPGADLPICVFCLLFHPL